MTEQAINRVSAHQAAAVGHSRAVSCAGKLFCHGGIGPACLKMPPVNFEKGSGGYPAADTVKA